jgi:predicted nuclease of predicted toxin-antitoxin system
VRAVLKASGIDAEHVGDIGLAQAEDADILQHAKTRSAVVVTLDADFHQLLAMSHDVRPSVIRIRIEGLKSEALATLLVGVVARCANDLDGGALVSVEVSRIRIHKLPLP